MGPERGWRSVAQAAWGGGPRDMKHLVHSFCSEGKGVCGAERTQASGECGKVRASVLVLSTYPRLHIALSM